MGASFYWLSDIIAFGGGLLGCMSMNKAKGVNVQIINLNNLGFQCQKYIKYFLFDKFSYLAWSENFSSPSKVYENHNPNPK